MHRRSVQLGIAIGALVFCRGLLAARAAVFDPGTFQTPDGALVLNPGGSYVEPYFATKALIVAQDGGLDVHESAMAWIEWLLPRQKPNGLFRRFCRTGAGDQRWRDCGPADADDSMLALWMQLLYRMTPANGMPADWEHSVTLAASQLEKLHNHRLGLYHISAHNHVALLMDNVEVYTTLKDVAQTQQRWNDPAAAANGERADRLAGAIQRIFWNGRTQQFRPSMQKDPFAFYPSAVAQVYPWLAGLRGRGQDPDQAWQQWKKLYGSGWITRRYDTHPWGLVALAAAELGDASAAACWTSQSDPLRGDPSWNVLEEAVWQSLRARLTQAQQLDPRACSAFLGGPSKDES